MTLGVALSWYGFIPQELPLGPSLATYAIDGETPISFQLKGLPANSPTAYNQKFFETAQLSSTSHTLQVVYQGNNSTPLTLTDLVIQNGTLSLTTSSVSSLATSATSVPSTSTSGKSSTPVGPIVGGVIGGLALIVFAVLGFFFFRRRQKRVAQEQDFISTPKPFDYSPLYPSSIPPSPPSGGTSQSQVSIAVTKGQTHLGSMQSVTNTNVSQSTGPPSTSSGATTHPANLRAVPLQQTALVLANPSASPPSASASSSAPSPRPPLPSKVGRKEEALVILTPQSRGQPSAPASVQSHDSWLPNPNVVLHADSGIRMPPSTSVVDVPPIYTPD